MAEGKAFPTFEDAKREGENIVRAKNDHHRGTEKANQEKLTGEHRSAMDEGIGNSESAASTASSEAQSQWQAKIAAVDAQHGREASAAAKTPQPNNRKAAYQAELAQREARTTQDKPFDRKAAYEASKQRAGDATREAKELREHRDERWDR